MGIELVTLSVPWYRYRVVNGPHNPKTEPETDPLVGATVGGRFRIERRLAAGGMGVVYQAVQQPLGRAVALKILRAPQDPRLDESHSQRFLREAAVVANLNHPNTVVVHDYGQDGKILYFAMEYVEGETLSARLNREQAPLTPEAAIHVGDQIASSLVDAHSNGLIHRDLKPGNVMLLNRSGDPDFVKVLDFGLVKLVETAAPGSGQDLRLTQSGILMGSPRYMSPEQVRGQDTIDHRADIYSFGALMCFMLTGHPPFPAGSQFEAMRAHVYTEPPTLRSLDPTCFASDRLETLVRSCLAKDPAERPQSMADVRMSLAACRLAPRADDVSDARPTVARALSAPPESTASILSQALADPGASTGAWMLRIGLIAAFLVAGAGLALLLPRPVDETASGSTIATTTTTEQAGLSSPPPVAPADPGSPPEPTPIVPSVSLVELRTQPAGARVRTLDGRDLGTTPVLVSVDGSNPLEVRVTARGYALATTRLDPATPLVELALRPRSRHVAHHSAPEPSEMTTMTMSMSEDRPQNNTIRDPWD